jgi:predicted DNA-binding ribbon-helix-helix protein
LRRHGGREHDSHRKEEIAVQASKHAATVRLDAPTWKHVEKLAKADRRPVAQLLQNIIADAVAAQQSRGQSADAARSLRTPVGSAPFGHFGGLVGTSGRRLRSPPGLGERGPAAD